MMEFLYELDQLREVASNMQNALGSLSNACGTLESIRDQTAPIWVGEAQEKFEANCNELKKQLEDYIQMLAQSRKALLDAVEKYDATENRTESTVSDLSAENIF